MSSNLPAQLQSRWDTFLKRYGTDVYFIGENGQKVLRDDAVFEVVNEELPIEDQVPVIVQGEIIDRFVFNGHYKINFIGHYNKPKAVQAAERMAKAQAVAAKTREDLQAVLVQKVSSTSTKEPAPVPVEAPVEPSIEDDVEARFEAMQKLDKRRKENKGK